MTKSISNDQAPEQPLKPNPALKRLEKLVGIWDIKGRTVGSKEDDVTGRMTSEWPPGGFFLKQRGEINCSSSKVPSLEIIGYDPSSQTFRRASIQIDRVTSLRTDGMFRAIR
jgi:hypothetical protein